MKTNLIIIAVVAVLIIAGGIGFYVANQYSSSIGTENLPGGTGTSETEQPETTPPETTTENSGAQTYNIEIKKFAFSPSEITIKVGDTVIWTNYDFIPHTVTSDFGEELNSDTFGKEETYSHTFNKAGTFNYYCAVHPSMKAKVIVN